MQLKKRIVKSESLIFQCLVNTFKAGLVLKKNSINRPQIETDPHGSLCIFTNSHIPPTLSIRKHSPQSGHLQPTAAAVP